MKLLSLPLNILTCCGFWRPDSCSTSYRKSLYYAYTAVTSFFIHGFTLTQVIDLFLVKNAQELGENAYMMLPMVMSACKAWNLTINRNQISALIDTLMTPPCNPNDEGEKEIQDKYDQTSHSNAKRYLYLIGISVSCNMVASLTKDVAKRELAYRAWIPFDYSSTGLYFIVYFHQIIGGTLSAVVQSATDSLIIGFILQICSQIEILEYRIEKITKGSKFPLSTCISHHDFIYCFSTTINDTFRVIIFCQFGISTLLICFGLFQLTKEPMSPYFVQLSLFLCVILAQIFYYCYYGNKLKFKSSQIATIIFGMDWLSLDRNAKHALIMIMRRAMTPIQFISAYVINVDLESFVALVKTSYSVYNLLEQTKEHFPGSLRRSTRAAPLARVRKLDHFSRKDKADTCEAQAKEANMRADKVLEEVAELTKKLTQVEGDLEANKQNLEQANKDLEEREKSLTNAESEVAALNRKVQLIEEDLERSEERLNTATAKLAEASQAADESSRMCKVLENRAQQDEERMDQLTNQLKEARLLAEDADGKSDEVSRKLAFVEDELEVAEDRVKSGEAKIMELEEELKVVGNSLKSLEVSEEKANQRVEEFKRQLKTLTVKLKEAEARAEFAEKTVKKLQKEVDRLEDELGINKDRYKSLADEMDSTFAELAGY
ncbi:hypothetical protein KPH14_007449 [Odynerus spinipes]|uniref:Tropomyosin n=3 Tax=Apocrita TaxID=7400 RepID=A0AAD9RAI2_9HYME|nr:hypothetical protein KPH14_007449 [Odynerus spinipes]